MIGRSTQILPNNWKLYFENVKDTYHASILHSFLTTFRINRLQHAGQHQHQRGAAATISARPSSTMPPRMPTTRRRNCAPTPTELADNSVVASVDEYGDQVSVQILTIFPNMVLQQVRNTIAVRVIRPRGVERTELDWVHLGFDDDDAR